MGTLTLTSLGRVVKQSLVLGASYRHSVPRVVERQQTAGGDSMVYASLPSVQDRGRTTASSPQLSVHELLESTVKYEAEHAYMQDEFVSCCVLASSQLGACLEAFQKQSLAILGNDFDSLRIFFSALISAALHISK